MKFVNFPGNQEIPTVKGKIIQEDYSSWDNAEKDVFICAEMAVDSLNTISTSVGKYLNVISLTKDSDGRMRKVIIVDMDDEVKTFVPFSVLLSSILMIVHKFDTPRRLRLYAVVSSSLPKVLENYPSVSKQPVATIVPVASVSSSTSRFAELGITPEEFEACQKAKYVDSYR